MGKVKYDTPITRYGELREEYSQTHNEYLSQEDLVKVLNISKSTISRIENGTLSPTIEVLKKYSVFFKVSMEYLTEYSNSRNPQNSTISHDIGITDDVVETLKLIKDISSEEYDYTAFVNAFINNKKATFNFINEMFIHLTTQYQITKKDNQPIQADNSLLVSVIMRYIENYVKPQLEPVLKKYSIYSDDLANIPIEEIL